MPDRHHATRRAAAKPRMPRLSLLGLAAAALLGLSACDDKMAIEPPPRATDSIAVEPQASYLAVPIAVDLDELTAILEREIPRELWTIDRPDQVCVAPSKVDVLGVKLKTPKLKCRITGVVTRGPMAISGSGERLIVTMPLHARISARDIAGIVSSETAEADARVRAVVTLDMGADWRPQAKVDIAYDWTREPGIDFLGQRITFTDKADARLQRVVAMLERVLPRELAKLEVRQKVQDAWAAAFTSLELNRADPAVWMRITPQQLRYGGYTVDGGTLTLRLGLYAQTETFVGDRQSDPEVTPLPPLRRMTEEAGRMLFVIPVIADYAELEPVIRKALVKRSARPFDVPGIGPVRARFSHITAYGTTGGRIAVGAQFSAQSLGDPDELASGTVWLTARPVNPPNSRRLSFDDLEIRGVTGNRGTDLLLKLANAPGLSETIANSLTQNFASDYDDLLAKVGRAIDTKREGDLLISAQIDDVTTGQLKATGRGLYLPVYGTGTARVMLDTR